MNTLRPLWRGASEYYSGPEFVTHSPTERLEKDCEDCEKIVLASISSAERIFNGESPSWFRHSLMNFRISLLRPGREYLPRTLEMPMMSGRRTLHTADWPTSSRSQHLANVEKTTRRETNNFLLDILNLDSALRDLSWRLGGESSKTQRLWVTVVGLAVVRLTQLTAVRWHPVNRIY